MTFKLLEENVCCGVTGEQCCNHSVLYYSITIYSCSRLASFHKQEKVQQKMIQRQSSVYFLSCFVICLVVMGIVLICNADGRGHWTGGFSSDWVCRLIAQVVLCEFVWHGLKKRDRLCGNIFVSRLMLVPVDKRDLWNQQSVSSPGVFILDWPLSKHCPLGYVNWEEFVPPSPLAWFPFVFETMMIIS